MLTGYPPFQSKTQEEIYKKVRNLSYVWPKESQNTNHIPEEAKNLVSACLNLVDEQRPDPDDIVEHPFFNMYDGCIPRQLDPMCRFNKPIWLKDQAPQGDCMVSGYGLDSDDKLRAYVHQVDDPSQRYHSCKAAFYSLCGVGRKPDGSARKSVGRNCSKSAYSECEAEDFRGLCPLVPLPGDFVYRWPHEVEGDWCLETARKPARNDDVALDSSTLSKRSQSVRTNAGATSRTNAALVAAQQRRMEPQSHAAALRQQARSVVAPVQKVQCMVDQLEPSSRVYRDPEAIDPVPPPGAVSAGTNAPSGGLAERPIRTRRMVSASQASAVRELERKPASQLAKSTSVPTGLAIGKTRAQSRRMEAASSGPQTSMGMTIEGELASRPEERRTVSRQTLLRSASRSDLRAAATRAEQPMMEDTASGQSSKVVSSSHGVGRSNSKSTSAKKIRSSLGLSPLFHQEDLCEEMPGTSLADVNTDLRLMLANLVNHSPARRRGGSRKQPHAYVIKWVDYTNRYGIGYVLDDGSVGCVFRSENGQPATGVVVRDGEQHIRRKARSVDNGEEKGIPYSESEQLVPRNGPPVEFYENQDDDLNGCRGIRRGLVSPSLFDVKNANVMKLRVNSGNSFERSDAEKIKRIKLVDQFGKYMIGSLGRHSDESLAAYSSSHTTGQFVKFYQRLGNVGIWGFGDGAFQVGISDLGWFKSPANDFQFNFPDHTKLVIAPGRTRSSSPWIDFYHLSPSAARYFSAKGEMHPSGFDTRAVASDEAATFLSIVNGGSSNSMESRIREILEANSFSDKIGFVKDILKGWIKYGRLGGRPTHNRLSSGEDNSPPEMFWQGAQERSQTGTHGTKFVWVTVGAPDGDGEYRSVVLKESEKEKPGKRDETNHEMEMIKERLRVLGRV